MPLLKELTGAAQRCGSVTRQYLSSAAQAIKRWSASCLESLRPHKLELTNVVLLSILFTVTVYFCYLTLPLSDGIAPVSRRGPRLPASFGVATLLALQVVTSYYAIIVFSQSIEAIQWGLSRGSAGIRLLTLLAFAPSTGVAGLMSYIFCSKHTNILERGVAFTRYFPTFWLS